MPTKSTQINIRLTPDMRAAVEAIKDRDGIPFSEQLRRALQRWIDDNAPRSKKGKR